MCSDTIGTEVISTDTVPAPSYSLFLGFAAIAEDLLVLYGSNLQKIGNDVLWLQSCDSTGWDFVSCLQMEQDRTSFASSFSFSRQVWQKTWRQFKILGCLSFSSQILHVCSSSPSRLMFGMGDTSRDCSGEAAGDISGEDMACLSKRNKDDSLCETRHWDSVLPHRISELNII